MATLKRRNAEGQWDFLQLTGADVSNILTDVQELNTQLAEKATQVDLKDRGISVKWYGADESLTDNTPNFTLAVSDLDPGASGSEVVRGGVITLPKGLFKGQLIISTTHASQLTSITIQGQGQENTIIDGTGLAAGKNVVEVRGGVFVKIKDINVQFAPNHGIAILGQQSGYTVWNHLQMENVRSSRNGKSGVYLERGFMANFQDVFATNNSEYGFNLSGYHTSLNFTNCYGANNTLDNFFINDAAYSTFENCGSDGSGRHGYNIRNSVAVGFINCGAESCQRSAFALMASATIETQSTINKGIQQVTFDGCFAFNCDLAGAGFGNFLYASQTDTSKITGVKIENCYDLNASKGTSIIANGSNIAIIEDNNRFVGTVNYQAAAERKLTKYPLKTGAVAVTAANTPICSLKNDYEGVQTYGGQLIVTARNGELTSGSVNSATYILLVGKHATGSGVTLINSNGLTSGGGASFPSFTFTLDTTNNKLLATPIASTTGTFYFSIEPQGFIQVTP